jgi:Domain of unknown function (DUF4268)/Endonuclease NucS
MYLINREKNNIEPVEAVTFKAAGMKERSNLQELIAKNPQSLGEDLLIIQKEFAGFDDTRERIDLLALDKKGNLVIIENKLDDTGRDVVWQALKYASYCSSLTSQEIKNIFGTYLEKHGRGDAQILLRDFFDDDDFEKKLNIGNNSQRIILVSGEFRKEVTSTALWLLNFGLRIQCFKVTAYKTGEQFLLDFDQIIPIKEAEEFIIKVATKNREESTNKEMLSRGENVRLKFWTQFLATMNKTNNYCANVSPTTGNWIPVALGMSGVSINAVVRGAYARVEVYFNMGSKAKNKEMFDIFFKSKAQIEKVFGDLLVWERMDDRVTCRIKWETDAFSVYEETDYPKLNEFLIDGITRMKNAFAPIVEAL